MRRDGVRIHRGTKRSRTGGRCRRSDNEIIRMSYRKFLLLHGLRFVHRSSRFEWWQGLLSRCSCWRFQWRVTIRCHRESRWWYRIMWNGRVVQRKCGSRWWQNTWCSRVLGLVPENQNTPRTWIKTSLRGQERRKHGDRYLLDLVGLLPHNHACIIC